MSVFVHNTVYLELPYVAVP